MLLLDQWPAGFILFGPPALVWAWGRALEQLAAGVERVAMIGRREERGPRDA